MISGTPAVTRQLSDWLDLDQVHAALRLLPSTCYPSHIEGRLHRGCQLQFRFAFNEKSCQRCRYEFVIALTDDDYLAKHEALCQDGYELLQHQAVEMQGTDYHQAIWVIHTY